MLQTMKYSGGVLQPATAKLTEAIKKTQNQYKNQKELLVHHLSKLNQDTIVGYGSCDSSPCSSLYSFTSVLTEGERIRESFLSPVPNEPYFQPKQMDQLEVTQMQSRLHLPNIHSKNTRPYNSTKDLNEYLSELFNVLDCPPTKKLPKISDPLRSEKQLTTRNFKKQVTFKDISSKNRKEDNEIVSDRQNTKENEKIVTTAFKTPKKHNLPKLILTEPDTPRKHKRHASIPSKLPAIKEKPLTRKKLKSKSPLNPEEAKIKSQKMKMKFSKITDPEEKTAVLNDILHAVHLSMMENKKKLGISHKTLLPEIQQMRSVQSNSVQSFNIGSKTDVSSDNGSKNDLDKHNTQTTPISRNETQSVMKKRHKKEELRDYLQQRSKSKLMT